MKLKLFSNFFKLFSFFITISFFLINSYSLEFDFDKKKYFEESGGKFEIEVSEGYEVKLFIEDSFISKYRSVIVNPIFELTDEIYDIEASLNSKITFINKNRNKNFKLKVDNNLQTLLEYNSKLEVSFDKKKTYKYTNTLTNEERNIKIIDRIVKYNFTNVNSHLVDGENKIKFVITNLKDSNEEKTFEYELDVEKYPNKIIVDNFEKNTNQRKVNISGKVTFENHKLYYIVNYEGSVTNIGLLNPINLDDKKFEVQLKNLNEGDNFVRLISYDTSFALSQDRYVRFKVDTTPPKTEFLNAYFKVSDKTKKIFRDGGIVFSNSKGFSLDFSTDASEIQYNINNNSKKTINIKDDEKNFTIKVNSLESDEEKNVLKITSKDLAGNIAYNEMTLFLDDKKPGFTKDTLKPDKIFKEKETHFSFEKISGQTNKPFIEVVIYVYEKGLKTPDDKFVTCSLIKDSHVGISKNIEKNDEKISANFNILNLINRKYTIKSDENGNFTQIISFISKKQSGDFNQDKVPSSSSQNNICFILKDKFGNIESDESKVNFDPGNSMWSVKSVSTTPNILYSSEIADNSANEGKTTFSTFLVLQYVGQGDIISIERPSIFKDTKSSKYSKYVSLLTNQKNFLYDKDSRELSIHFISEISSFSDLKPVDYPSNIDLGFSTKFSYSLDDDGDNIPIDIQNPVFFKATLGIETPIDSNTWLTPEKIKDIQDFLNKSIGFTKSSSNFARQGTLFMFGLCTLAKIKHSLDVASIFSSKLSQEDKKKELENKERNLYRICDRVACSKSPENCNQLTNPGQNSKLIKDSSKLSQLNNFQNEVVFEEGDFDDNLFRNKLGAISSKLNKIKIRKECTISEPNDGFEIEVQASIQSLEEDTGSQSSLFGSGYYSFDKEVQNRFCILKTDLFSYTEKGESEEISDFKKDSVLSGSGACYSEKSPFFDDTRCYIPGIVNGVPGADPSLNIFESVRCGCITSTYSHLKNLLKIQESIYQCLEQVKVGNVKGSYCQRLLAISVCDVATNIFFNSVFKSSRDSRQGGGGVDPRADFVGAYKASNKEFENRYKGSWFTQGDLSGTQLANKVCIGAFTGDFTLLTENVFSSIEENQVKPVLGPPFPESRIQGYNPLTGDLSISYRFTYGGLSGGQQVQTKAKLLCDPSRPSSDYCPQNIIVERDEVKNLLIPKQGSVQDTIIITELKSKYWYNTLELTHSYLINDKREEITKRYNILHKSEMIPECSFSLTASDKDIEKGLSCEVKNYNSDSSFLPKIEFDKELTNFYSKSTPTFYKENKINLNLFFSRKSEETNGRAYLYYGYKCENFERIFSPVPIDLSNLESDKIFFKDKILYRKDIELSFNSNSIFAKFDSVNNNNNNNNKDSSNIQRDEIFCESRFLFSNQNNRNFRTFEDMKKSLVENDKVISDVSSNTNFLEKDFIVSKTSPQNIYSVYNLIPSNNQVITFDEDSKINFYNYIRNSQENYKGGLKLKYKITFEGSSSIEEEKTISSGGISSHTLNDKIKKNIENENQFKKATLLTSVLDNNDNLISTLDKVDFYFIKVDDAINYVPSGIKSQSGLDIQNPPDEILERDTANYRFEDEVNSRVNPVLLTKLTSISQKMKNHKFIITSGYRDHSHNQRVGGAKNSEHLTGNAIDISTSGLDVSKLIELAIEEGFTGIGIYKDSDSMHLDLREVKTAWGPDFTKDSIPESYKEVLGSGGFQVG